MKNKVTNNGNSHVRPSGRSSRYSRHIVYQSVHNDCYYK